MHCRPPAPPLPFVTTKISPNTVQCLPGANSPPNEKQCSRAKPARHGALAHCWLWSLAATPGRARGLGGRSVLSRGISKVSRGLGVGRGAVLVRNLWRSRTKGLVSTCRCIYWYREINFKELAHIIMRGLASSKSTG